MTRGPSRSLGLLGRVADTSLLKPAALAAHEAIAFRVAARLAHLGGVDSVHLLGSLAVLPREFVPGQSDIDLMLVTDFSAAEEERRFLESAFPAMGWWSLGGRLIKHLDYVDRQTLPLFLSDDPFGVDIERRGRLLRGGARLESASPRPPESVRLARFVLALGRFAKAAPLHVHPTLRRPEPINSRGAKRLLRDVLAGALDRPRVTPLLSLLGDLEREHGRRVDPERVLADATSREGRVRLVTLALEALDVAARGFADAWRAPAQSWSVRGEAPRSEAFGSLARSARRAGVELALAVPRPEPRRPGHAFAIAERAEDAVDAARRWWAFEPPWPPTPATPALVEAAAALLPVPSGAALSLPSARLVGEHPPLPIAPPEAVQRLFLRMQVAQGARRAGARLLRFERTDAQREAAAWAEVRTARAALEALEGAPLDLDVLRPEEARGDVLDALRSLRRDAARLSDPR